MGEVMEQAVNRRFVPGQIIVAGSSPNTIRLYAETNSDPTGRHNNATTKVNVGDVATIISVRQGFANDEKLFVLLSRTGTTGWTWSSLWELA
jgi:hypothetical protein